MKIQLPEPVQCLNLYFCGCGSPATAWETIKEYLEQKASEDFWKPLETGEQILMAYLLDYLGLTEHGSGINGASITDDGQEVLAFLQVRGTDWQDDPNNTYWVHDMKVGGIG